MSQQSLYAEIGGREAVEAVVSDFYDRMFADESLTPYFEDTDEDELFAHQVQFISAVAGGPVEYDGTDMEEAHDHLGITHEAFDKTAENLEAALRENGVSEENREAILSKVEALREPVVTESASD
ncbi:group I truncated hemoglobin [Halospeciosus flavus]|uniref:Group 1 truncated hemoglobin n=1 Tax=Halospeciosus flavus TaxID=3032283 RepID=A0ABD5Z1S2_9EURY|nr:group 1 truncated hemoglobin [Halospeciosus flavus]